MPAEDLPTAFCTYLFLLSCFVHVPPVNGFFVKNCYIKGSLKHPVNLMALCNKRELIAIPHHVPNETRVLDLSWNQLRNITLKDFIHLTKLQHLNASHNQIKHVEEGTFKSLCALEELNLASNQLTNISGGFFQNLFNLTILRLDNNQITNISASTFAPLISLVMLNLSGNNLLEIHKAQPVLQLLNIRELHIARNGFTSFQTIQISNISSELKVLDMSQNHLQVFRITADVFPHLNSLGLAFSNGSMTWDVQNINYLRNVRALNLTGTQKTKEMKSVLQTFNTSLTDLRLYQFKEQTIKPLIITACLISTLRNLHLQLNSMKAISEKEMKYCGNLTTLDLSENNLKNITNLAFRGMKKLNRLILSRNKLDSFPTAIDDLSSLETLDLSYNNINRLTCSDNKNLTKLHMSRVYRTSLSVINACSLQDLTNLQTLIISSNRLISVKDFFRTNLQKLKFLDLAQNKLNSIQKQDFVVLHSLTHLILNDNQISYIEEGAFEGLRRLKVLNLQSNKITQSSISDLVFSGLTNLKYLLLNNNYLSYSDEAGLSRPPFTNLKSLDTLSIHSQGHKGMLYIPSNLLEGLKSLQVFIAKNLNLNSLHPDTFSYTPQLQCLDLSRNELTSVSMELFKPLQRLQRLYMSSTGLQTLDFITHANLTEIEYMQVRQNALAVITKTTITSLAKLTYVDLQENTFSCDCTNFWFVNWAIGNNITQVFNADQLTCNYPSNFRGYKLLYLDLKSCIADMGFCFFISTTIVILLIMCSSILYHFLKWQLVYTYYCLLAFLYDSNQQRMGQSSGFQYDAFISYNTHDELWVMRELLPKLEGEQGWKLCLHHRDFQPGKPIMDNIVDSIYSSRKTICVISRHYLESEWCSSEIQVASFRLFDEKKDILILVFLENIPAHQLSPYYRMRNLIKQKTYLSWPKPGEDTRVFWQKLRVALETKGTSEEESNILSGIKRM